MSSNLTDAAICKFMLCVLKVAVVGFSINTCDHKKIMCNVKRSNKIYRNDISVERDSKLNRHQILKRFPFKTYDYSHIYDVTTFTYLNNIKTEQDLQFRSLDVD